MDEQGLLAEGVHAGRRGWQAVRQQQEACRAGSAGSVPSATSRTGTCAVARVATIWAGHRWPRPRWTAGCRNVHPGLVGTAGSVSLSMARACCAVLTGWLQRRQEFTRLPRGGSELNAAVTRDGSGKLQRRRLASHAAGAAFTSKARMPASVR